MSPTIRIDDDVFDELKKNAEPFIDSPNSVLRRILGLGEPVQAIDIESAGAARPASDSGSSQTRGGASSRRRRRRTSTGRPPRAKAGSILHEAEYEIPMLEIINSHGGRAPAREVLDELGTKLAKKLTTIDYEELASGDVRWRNRAQFVRLRLIERGDMVKDSPRGVWEISDQGRLRIAATAA